MRQRFGVCLGSGLLLELCFPPFDLPWPGMLVALAGWMWAIGRMRMSRALLGTFVFAFAFQLLLLRWMTVVGNDAWLVVALVEALLFVPVGAAYRLAGDPLRGIPAVAIALPAMDAVRDNAGPLAFGWGQLAFANVEAPWVRLLPSTSQWFVSGFIAALAACIAALFLKSGVSPRVLAGCLIILGFQVPLLLRVPDPVPPSTANIALVQGGVVHTGLGFSGDARQVLDRHSTLTASRLRGTDARLVVWPENAVDVDPYTDKRAREALLSTARTIGRPLLVGALLNDKQERVNAALLVDGGRIATVYEKRRLVPFGEYLPFRSFFISHFERASFIPRDFRPGEGVGEVKVAGARLGIVICFEIADETIVREALGRGETALILQTNNATYAGLGQSAQQLRIAQMRALQFGVPVYVVSTTGPSAVIDGRGRILRSIKEGGTGVLQTKTLRKST